MLSLTFHILYEDTYENNFLDLKRLSLQFTFQHVMWLCYFPLLYYALYLLCFAVVSSTADMSRISRGSLNGWCGDFEDVSLSLARYMMPAHSRMFRLRWILVWGFEGDLRRVSGDCFVLVSYMKVV